MHEASAIEAVVKIVAEEAVKRGAPGAPRRVLAVHLVVGEATGHMEESLLFYFRSLSTGGPAEGAVLDVRYVKPQLRCSSCDRLFERKRFSFECPHCGGQGVLTKIGSEFYIDSIEIEEAAAE
ncbi:MAG TPA: hydrogenase maturation nickel metallochaperone HypA [Rectinemataceae bacterium]|nr:hydrogenase maturation nickel metallochaperone HypA [Rectinemataceae bacterium]